MSASEEWDSFLDPRLVCVVGASSDPRRIGGRLVRYSVESGFAGRIVPVNPRHESVFGIPAVPNLDDVHETPDWVVVALPREHVPRVVEQAGAMGARNVAVVSAGFAEVDETGRAMQEDILATARRHGMRLLGPNSNGFMNVDSGAYFAFTPVIDSARPFAGEVAVVTQSAAIGTYLINSFRTTGVGIRHWLHTGNEADVTVLRLLRVLAERRAVRAIALSFEVLRDMPVLRDTLQVLAENGVALGVLQAGLSEHGRRASEAHTAALIGAEADVLGDLLRAGGAFPAGSIRELVGFIQAAVNHDRLPVNPRLGLVTTSGGVGILMADAAEAAGVTMPTLSPALQETILSYAPFAHPPNPVDTTAQVINEPGAFQQIVIDCVDSAELDVAAVFVAHGLAGAHDPTLRQVVSVAEQRPAQERQTSLAALGVIMGEGARALQNVGVSVFTEPVDLANAIGAFGRTAARRNAFVTKSAIGSPAVPGDGPALLDRYLGEVGPTSLVDEVTAKSILRAYGARTARGRVVSSAEEAVATAAELGFPVVLKVASPELAHKAASDGLRLNLWTDTAVRVAFDHLADMASHHRAARLLLERQEQGDEIFVSCARHPSLGLLLAIGAGGSGVEQAGTVSWIWPPVTADDVREALGHVAAESHVTGLVEIAGALVRLLTDEPRAHTVETNPVLLTPDGRTVVVDALVELAPPSHAAS
jgi:acyl-CoA synthetase (NDP forming)